MQRPPRKPGTKIVTRPWIIRWFISGSWSPPPPCACSNGAPASPAPPSVGQHDHGVRDHLVQRGQHRPGHAPRTPGTVVLPSVPLLGWIILGWILTWAAVELGMLQRLLDTTSLSGREWVVVLALSLVAPAVVAATRSSRLRRQTQGLRPGRQQAEPTEILPLSSNEVVRHAVRGELRGGPASPGDRAPAGPGTHPPDPVQRRRPALRRRAVGGAGQGRAPTCSAEAIRDRRRRGLRGRGPAGPGAGQPRRPGTGCAGAS